MSLRETLPESWRGKVIETIPEGFTDRLLAEDWRDRPLDAYYPPGVSGTTQVEVIIRCQGRSILYKGEAGSFGWSARPAMPCCGGLEPADAPITHYKILA